MRGVGSGSLQPHPPVYGMGWGYGRVERAADGKGDRDFMKRRSFFRSVTGGGSSASKKGDYRWLGESRSSYDDLLNRWGSDTRLVNYLSASFKSSRPLRRERRLDRNRALLVGVSFLLGLYWTVHRLFL